MFKPALLLIAALLPLAAPAHDSPHDATAGSRAELQVYDRSDGRYLPLYRHRGRNYVAGEPGHEYEIHLRSRQGERLLAVTSVDGVNVLSGQTASTAQGGYVLPAWDELRVDGWRKSMDRVARFYFTTLPDSYAARTGRPDDVGVIGVALFEEQRREPAWFERREMEAPSADRLESQAGSGAGAAAPEAKARSAPAPRLGTGHGASQWSGAELTSFERASSRPAEVISIWYDSRRNLVAQGVIPREHHPRPRHRPEPFPAGFVPDP
ncbi:hypothetical protein D0B54_03080 [Solimonas sp. K1W22B-7]|uniref:hypothetical protein n=1 Tax=Solimonas sp. K1W22B-7 TaxID=2303331 RepID=UPI000E33230E|nr:hypothetical protein [Solimonas sp. K1W22B-7]AXQ27712.1 hypothetical protein D0B54_03080 [Solimonas sp. K1W22B-7]